MRKIEQAMIAAIRDYRPWRDGNTAYDGAGTVTLHGNAIAKFEDSPEGKRGSILFNLCGWNTPTTRSRINALANEFGRSGVRSIGGNAFTGKYRPFDQVPTEGWF